MSYEGLWTLVTGAGKRGRVGAKIARHMAERGSNIYLHYRSNKAEAEEVKKEVETAGEKNHVSVELVHGDLSNEEDVAAMFESIAPDIVIHNAAVFEPNNVPKDATLTEHLKSHAETLQKNLDANTKAVHLVTEAALYRMQKEGKVGTIIFIGDAFISKNGVYPENLTAYTASKSFIENIVRQYAKAYGKKGFRFFGILNGPIEPPPSAPAQTVQDIQDEIPLPEESLDPWIGGEAVAEAIDHVLQSKGINGESIAVDGGRAWETGSEHE